MQRVRRQYAEGGARARRAGAAAQLGGQLGDVQRIMMQNIDDVLQRGAILSGNCAPLTLILLYNCHEYFLREDHLA